MKNGTETVRSIRQDRHTMASIVMSYPVPRVAIVTEEARQKLAAWERRNIEWLQQAYGDQLRVVMAHEDESQPHLHAWLLPDDPGADATTLHPGKIAKKAAEADAKAKGQAPREAVKAGNRALKAAMTEWQDTYYHAVGAPEGLTRTGPLRRRLTREQWKSEKAAAKATAVVAAEAQAEADRILAEAQAVAKGVRSLAKEVEAGTIRQGNNGMVIVQNPAALQPALSVLEPAIRSAAAARTQLDRERAAVAEEQRLAEAKHIRRLDVQRRWDERRGARLEARSVALDGKIRHLDQRAEKLSQAEAQLEIDRAELNKANRVLDGVIRWIAKGLRLKVPSGIMEALAVLENAAKPKMRMRPVVIEPPERMVRISVLPSEEPLEPVEEPEASGPGF